ncbi:transposase [Brevibacterium antiquum]|uniref:transposase n=1 Tax=Brevibacterium antiquum TaxID=234835 RepID=UPI003AF010C3
MRGLGCLDLSRQQDPCKETAPHDHVLCPAPRSSFTPDSTADAVAMVAELEKSRAEVARDLDINKSTLGKWIAKAIGTEGTGSGSARRARTPTVVTRQRSPSKSSDCDCRTRS